MLAWSGGLLVAALIAWWIHTSNQRLYAQRLDTLADQVSQQVRQRFGLYEYGLRGARGAVVAAGGAGVSRKVFAAYMDSRDTAREFPGARGFGFIRRVPRDEVAGFLASARAEGPADFGIRELEAHEGEHFVIQYIYPLDANSGATGLDVASEANRRDAALAAARDGQVRLTAPITLVQAGSHPRRGFLAFLPVYRTGAAIHTPAARDAAALGWTYAPLVVDDVLAGLGPQMQEIGIQLTDATEQAPFFDSMRDADRSALASVAPTTRTIDIYGRQWVLKAHALPALAMGVRPLSAAWVGAGTAAVATLLALLVWNLLQRRRERTHGVQDEADRAVPVTPGRFLRSELARWAALAYVAFLVLYLSVDYQVEWRRQLGDARRSLKAVVDSRAERLVAAQATRRKTMLFLAEVPPVEGLVRSTPTGTDPRDGSSHASWEQRMQLIFSAHLKASPEVSHARLIGVADEGRELVRVERRGQDVVVVPRAGLQPMGDRPYMQQTLRLPAGEVWVSDLDLRREHGKVEEPQRPTIRYATPIHGPDGQPFGIVVVNVDVADRQAESAAAAPAGGTLHVMNAAGDFLQHPDPARTFGFERGRPYRWQDEYQPAQLPAPLPDDGLPVWRGPRGLVVSATASVSPNANSSIGTLRYTASLPIARIEAAVWRQMRQNLVLPLAAGAASALLLYF